MATSLYSSLFMSLRMKRFKDDNILRCSLSLIDLNITYLQNETNIFRFSASDFKAVVVDQHKAVKPATVVFQSAVRPVCPQQLAVVFQPPSRMKKTQTKPGLHCSLFKGQIHEWSPCSF